MRLKQLQISGFKSFADKTVIGFPPGISAIVGPNGCGKSNILDALKWVMGEQSSKQLRGKTMDDVIFAGTEGSAPAKVAEVSLVLSNDDKGSCPDEYKDHKEIIITRKLSRDGESGYLINRKNGRLRDIQNIFLGSGMGSRTYSFVQQNNVGAITEAGPDERRVFIEEAAGITRYKQQKKEALRKMDDTNQNMLRVKDIVNEVNKQMRALQRQAKKAEQFQEFQNKILTLDVTLAFHYYNTFEKQIQETQELLNRLTQQDEQQTSRLQELNQAVESIQRERLKTDNAISEQKARRFDIQRRIDKYENNLEHAQNDISRLTDELRSLEDNQTDLNDKQEQMGVEIEKVREENVQLNQKAQDLKLLIKEEEQSVGIIRQELDTWNQNLEDHKAKLMDLLAQEARYKNIHKNASESKQSLENRLKQTKEERSKAQKRVTELTNKEEKAKETMSQLQDRCQELELYLEDTRVHLDKTRTFLSQQIKRVQNLDVQRSKIKSRFQALKKMEANFEWYKDGVKAVMERQKVDPRILNIAADLIEPYLLFEDALEAAMGEALQYIIVEDQSAAKDIIAYLQEKNSGRCGLIPQSVIRSDTDSLSIQHEKHILNYMTIHTGNETIVQSILYDVLVASDIDEAIGLWKKNPGYRIVTQKGETITKQGIVIGGSKGEGIFTKKQEIKKLEEQLTQIEEELISGRVAQQDLENQTRDLERDLQQKTQSLNMYRNNLVEAEKELYRISEDLKHANRNMEFVIGEMDRLTGEANHLDAEISKSDMILSDITSQISKVQTDITESSNQITKTSDQMESYQQKLVDLKLEATTIQTQLESCATTLRRLNDFQKDATGQVDKIKDDISEKTRKIVESKKQIQEYNEYISVHRSELEQLNEVLTNNESTHQDIINKMRENNQSITTIQNARENIKQKIRELELEQSQRQLKLENIIARIKERHDLDLLECKDKIELESKMSIKEMEDELSICRKKIAQIGAVNTEAITEYEQLKERFEFLDRDQTDLVTAMEDLNKVIKKINKITKEKFQQTFDEINAKLQDVFPQLFQGGSAKLIMTDPDNPLDTGVEFMVHPPGKRLTRLTLLSGGEKALSAIAFIFSIFLIRPAAFCVMDEIDAPLDEANVQRFNNLLKIIGEKSQIIMVTHNKGSMEFADILFGITMEQKGISKIVSVNLSDSN